MHVQINKAALTSPACGHVVKLHARLLLGKTLQYRINIGPCLRLQRAIHQAL